MNSKRGQLSSFRNRLAPLAGDEKISRLAPTSASAVPTSAAKAIPTSTNAVPNSTKAVLTNTSPPSIRIILETSSPEPAQSTQDTSPFPSLDLPKDISPFPFLNLPQDIRLMVYDQIFPYDDQDSVPGAITRPSSTRLVPLLTCRAIYFEARAIAFRNTVFHVTHHLLRHRPDFLGLITRLPYAHPPFAWTPPSNIKGTPSPIHLAVAFAQRPSVPLVHVTRVSFCTTSTSRLFPFGSRHRLMRTELRQPCEVRQQLAAALPALRTVVLRDREQHYGHGLVKMVALFETVRMVVAVNWIMDKWACKLRAIKTWRRVEANVEMSARGLGYGWVHSDRHLGWMEDDTGFGICFMRTVDGGEGKKGEYVHIHFCGEEEARRKLARPWRNQCLCENAKLDPLA